MAPATPSVGEGKEPFHAVKSLFKPYQVGTFGFCKGFNSCRLVCLQRNM